MGSGHRLAAKRRESGATESAARDAESKQQLLPGDGTTPSWRASNNSRCTRRPPGECRADNGDEADCDQQRSCTWQGGFGEGVRCDGDGTVLHVRVLDHGGRVGEDTGGQDVGAMMRRMLVLGELPSGGRDQHDERDRDCDDGVPSRILSGVVVPHNAADCSSGLSPICGPASSTPSCDRAAMRACW